MTEIVCPSGLAGRIRSLRVREERILADRQLARRGEQIDKLLAACWEETIDPGPYDFAGAAPNWSKVLQGDRFFALIHVRVATYGPQYSFSVNCAHPACRARIDWQLDLNELPVKKLAEESRETFLTTNRFETVLPDSARKVVFRLLTGEDERKLGRRREGDGAAALSALLAARVVEVEGIEGVERKRFLEELSFADADFLIDDFDRVDCGVDTTIEVECQECLGTQDVELPFDQGFFLPGKERTARRRARSSSSRS